MKYFQLLFLSIIVFSGCFKSNKVNAQASNIVQEIETTGPKNGTLLIIGGRVNDMIWDKLQGS